MLNFFIKGKEDPNSTTSRKGKEDPNSTTSRPSLARQQDAISVAFCWRAGDGTTLNNRLVDFVIFQGIRTSIAKKPNIFVIFQRGPDPLSTPTPPPHPLDPHMRFQSNPLLVLSFGRKLPIFSGVKKLVRTCSARQRENKGETSKTVQ